MSPASVMGLLLLGSCSVGIVAPVSVEDLDGDGHLNPGDCDDRANTRFPGAPERCDGEDDDCDGLVDEGFDLDADGFPTALDADCVALGPADCDDQDPGVHPGATEQCDGRDQDCDGTVDLEVDADRDGWRVCEDCDDADPGKRPDAPERCNGADDDCDGRSDEGFDEDGDGFGDCLDCDDALVAVHPGATEVCNGRDDDCDTEWDEGFDEDGDGFTVCRGDCDDAEPEVNVWAEEVCDGVDNDCDPTTDEAADHDGDGTTLCGGDCDDGRAEVFPGGHEVCDGLDDDCDDLVDEGGVCAPCLVEMRRDRAYLFCEAPRDPRDAAAACEATGYRLVEPRSESEDDWLSNQLAELRGDRWWIGLHDLDADGAWTWEDSSAPLWTAWAPGEPLGDGTCAATRPGVGWEAVSCTTTAPYACEVRW